MSLPVSRIQEAGASAQEVSSLQVQYGNLSPAEQVGFDLRLESISNGDIATMLTAWRAGAPFGGALPYGSQIATLTGSPLDDAFAISAGTGFKLPILPDSGAVGDVIVPVMGQSNPVGIGEFLDPVKDTVDSRVFQLGGTPGGAYFQQRVQAFDPLMHHQPQPAPACVGFSMYFARELAKILPPNLSVLLLPCAHGSTGFTDPTNSWDPAFVPPTNGTNLFWYSMGQIDAALQLNPNNRLLLALWHQGEGDSSDTAIATLGGQAGYAAKLDSVIDTMRARYSLPNLDFVVGPMNPDRVANPPVGATTGYPLVNAAHRDTPRRRTHTWWFPGPFNSYNSAANGGTIHYNADGQHKLGAGDGTVRVPGYFKSYLSSRKNDFGTTPPTPISLALVQTGTSVVASWIQGPLGRTTQYAVQADTGSGFTPVTRSSDIATFMNPTQSFTGLALGSTISVRVAAINEVGQSDWSPPATLTLATVPAQPTNFAAPSGLSGANRQGLTWDPSPSGTGAVTSWQVQYRRHIDSSWTVFGTTTTNSATVTGLVPGTSYDYEVIPSNAAGAGPVSASATQTTTTLPPLATTVGIDMAVGWEPRKVRAAYSGACWRVRRSSDNTELDIGFDANGNVDEAAMLAFVGTGDGFLSKWYNQGTQANSDWVQTTQSAQPRIVLAGVTEKVNGVPMPAGLGAQYMIGAFASLYAAGASGGSTTFTVAQDEAVAASAYVFVEDHGGVSGGFFAPLAFNGTGQPLFNDGSTSRVGSGVVVDGILAQWTSVCSASGTAYSISQNGTSKLSVTGITRPTVTCDNSTLFARRGGSVNAWYSGHIGGLSAWTSVLTAQQQSDAAASYKSYYGTP